MRWSCLLITVEQSHPINYQEVIERCLARQSAADKMLSNSELKTVDHGRQPWEFGGRDPQVFGWGVVVPP